MVKQLSTYDQIERLKQEGIEAVYRNADTTWKRAAAAQLMSVAKQKRNFTSDDILIPLEQQGIVTKDNRAIAAILQSAARMNLIKATDKFIRCRRKSRHGAPVMVWESLM